MCCKDGAEGCGVYIAASPEKREVPVCKIAGALLHSQGIQTSTHSWQGQAGFWGRRGKERPGTKPFHSHYVQLPFPYPNCQLLLGSQTPESSQGGKNIAGSVMAPAGKSHIQILRRVGVKCEKALEQGRPVIPLPDGPVGSCTCGVWSGVTRSNHCVVTVKRETGHLK